MFYLRVVTYNLASKHEVRARMIHFPALTQRVASSLRLFHVLSVVGAQSTIVCLVHQKRHPESQKSNIPTIHQVQHVDCTLFISTLYKHLHVPPPF
jgi:hypothetical protein